MRSTEPSSENPWPHDMVITVEEAPHALGQLLWIREAWSLGPAIDDSPPRLIATPAPVDPTTVSAYRRDTWEARWPVTWRDCLAHAGVIRDPTLHGRLIDAPLGSAERGALLDQIAGPSWRPPLDGDALPAAFDEWWSAHTEWLMRRMAMTGERSPERRSLDALIAAWRAGLTEVVVIPCRGEFTRRIGAATLLVTSGSRDDPGAYSEALRSFTG